YMMSNITLSMTISRHSISTIFPYTTLFRSACFVKGSQSILDRAKERLKIEPGQVTPDGKFSLDDVRCVGACGLAPVFMVNDEVYGNATVKKFDEILDKYMNK